MSRSEKLLKSFKACRGTFKYSDLVRVLNHLGYEQLSGGKTGGSSRRFFNKTIEHPIYLDEPHDGEVKPGMVRRIRKKLKEVGLI